MSEFPLSQGAALKAEISTDPKGLGLAAMTDAAAATKLNEVGASNETANSNTVLPAYQVVNAIDPAEWAVLTAQEKQRLSFITGAGEVDVANANTRSQFQAMFAAGTATRTALLNLIKRPLSRAEALWGAGVRVEPWDVARARALP